MMHPMKSIKPIIFKLVNRNCLMNLISQGFKNWLILLFHASLIGQAPPKLKWKISRSPVGNFPGVVHIDALGES